MNLQEFSALKVGDQVENPMTNGKGTISAVRPSWVDRSVSVKWGPVASMLVGPEFSYGVHSTAWMHWNKIEPQTGEHSAAGTIRHM